LAYSNIAYGKTLAALFTRFDKKYQLIFSTVTASAVEAASFEEDIAEDAAHREMPNVLKKSIQA